MMQSPAPDAAHAWLSSRVVGPRVLQLGAPDPRLTAELARQGHQVDVRTVDGEVDSVDSVGTVIVCDLGRQSHPDLLVNDALEALDGDGGLLTSVCLAGEDVGAQDGLSGLLRVTGLALVEDDVQRAAAGRVVWVARWRKASAPEEFRVRFAWALHQALSPGGHSSPGSRRSGDRASRRPRAWRRARAPRSQVPVSVTGDRDLPLGLRVGFVGMQALADLGQAVRAVVVSPALVGRLAEEVGRPLDMLVIDASPGGWDEQELALLCAEARELGAVIVGHARPADATRSWTGLADLDLADPRQSSALTVRPVDPLRVNPRGWRRQALPGVIAVASGQTPPAAWTDAMTAIDGVAGRSLEWVFDPVGNRPLPDGVRNVKHPGNPEALAAAAKPFLGAVDHPGLHDDPVERASTLVALAAAGVPVVTGALDVPLLGPRLAAALRGVSMTVLRSEERRERASVELRRAALSEHSTSARWRQIADRAGIRLMTAAPVSIVLASRRPEYLAHAVTQVNRQSYAPRELVLVAHGDEFPPGLATRLQAEVDGDVVLVRAPASWSLGEALNAGVDAASGELITKIDDDDWYGPDHLTDLVLAWRYSGAPLVAKGAEFVYLKQLDITLRRFTGGAERTTRSLGGGAMLMARADLRAVGGWPRVPHRVDQALITAVEERVGRTYRTHGYGYVLHRHGVLHTWTTDVDYFLEQSDAQRRGLDLAFAGVEPPL